jgi:HEAT repeat protein
MLDATSKKILKLLESGQPPELRAAAARVLGYVVERDGGLTESLAAALADPEPSVRLAVMETIGKLRIEQALPQLLAKVSEGGIESEGAAHAAARLGVKGTRALQDLMHQVAPGLRRRIAAALASGGTASGNSAAVAALLDSDPGVVDAAVRSLISEIPTLTPAQRRSLVDHVLEIVEPKKGGRLPAASEAALVRLLAAVGDPRTEKSFWTRVGPEYPLELRIASLQALGTLPTPTAKGELALLFACACDRDFRVAAPALMILKGLSVTPKTLPDWLSLLDAPDGAVRRFGIEKLGDRDSADVAEGLLRQLDHPDHGLRDLALARLAALEQGRSALADALIQASTPERAWTLARAQAPFARTYGPKVRERLFAEACTELESVDRRADPLLFLLREIDQRALRDQMEARALALRKKKNYAGALIYWRYLSRDPACSEDVRFETAACALKLSAQDLSVESRTADPCLQQFARLVHSHDVDPAVRIKAARWLEPQDLFYLGFHFAEGARGEREFGAEALRLAVQRSPRSKIGRDAKSKLRSAGLE